MTTPRSDTPSHHLDAPANPDFYRRALDYLPSPAMVVGPAGGVLYANHALIALGGWTGFSHGQNILDFVHPGDHELVGEGFTELVTSPGARVLGTNRPWAPMLVRLIAQDGRTVPVEVVGAGGVLDPAIQGIIYTVQPADERLLIGRLLEGLSRGASMHQLLSLVATVIAAPPLDFDAAILQSTKSDTWVVAASTSPNLADTIRGSAVGLPWRTAARTPVRVRVDQLPEHVRDSLTRDGYREIWHLAVESPLTANTLRIVASSPTIQMTAGGSINRLMHARELAAAVLLRSETNVLLSHAAAHDQLTNLPNRAAFYQIAESANVLAPRGALYLDLNGLKRINARRGVATGDAVLQVVADRLRSECASTDTIARLGGTEFAVMLTGGGNTTSMEDASDLAARLLAAIEEPIIVAGTPLTISSSIGVAFAASGISSDHLLTWADAALHDAQTAGGARIRRHGVVYG